MKRKGIKTGVLPGICECALACMILCIIACMTACSPARETESENALMRVEEIALEEEPDALSDTQGSITVGTVGIPYSELLTQAKILLAKDGWELNVVTYDDLTLLNQDLLNRTLDAHLFAHETYLESYNDVQETNLIAVTPVIYEKYGIYSRLNVDLTKYANGITVGIPAEETQQAKALSFLRDMGYLTLKEGLGLTVSTEDIAEDVYNVVFVEYTQDTAEECLKQCDYCVMGGNQAILAGLEPHKDMLAEETAQMESAKLLAAYLVTTPENAESEKIRVLEEVLGSETIKQYVKDYYKEAYATFAE